MAWMLDWLFPPRCPFCRHFLPKGEGPVCRDCLEHLPHCRERAEKHKPTFVDGVVCALVYEGAVRRAMHRYKFGGRLAYGKTFAGLLARRVEESGVASRVQAVCWVPCHRATRRERGYDQAEELARQTAARLGLPAAPLLKKVRHTPPMYQLDAAQRRANVLGAFAAGPEELHGLSVLLVDDIFTTGATFSECARVLREQGASHVYGAALAQTPRRPERNKQRTS